MENDSFDSLSLKILEKKKELESKIHETDLSKIKFTALNKDELETVKDIIEMENKLKTLNPDSFVSINDIVKITVFYSEDDIEDMKIKLVSDNPSFDNEVPEISVKGKIGSAIHGEKYNSEVYCDLNNKKTLIKILEKKL